MARRRSVGAALVAVVLAVIGSNAVPASATVSNIELLASVTFPEATHLEFVQRELGVDETGQPIQKVFALAASRDANLGGIRIFDISDPAAASSLAEPVAYIPCKANGPADVAVVETNGRTLVVIGNQGAGGGCTVDGLRARTLGVFDITDPYNPITVGWPSGVQFAQKGAHTVVTVPGKPIVYVSSQQTPDRSPSVEIVDFSAWPACATVTPSTCAPAKQVPLLQTGSSPHDISFSPNGKRAYMSSVDASFVLDTSDPLSPKTVGVIAGPDTKFHHEAVLHPNGRHLLVVDETIAAPPAGTPVCPGGGVVIYDLGPKAGDGNAWEAAPVRVGTFFAEDYTTAPVLEDTHGTPLDPSCTAHEFQFSADGRWTPFGWMGAGVRVFDLSEIVAATDAATPVPVRVTEIGHWRIPETDIWAAKSIALPGHERMIYATDTAGARQPGTPLGAGPGFKVFRYTGELP